MKTNHFAYSLKSPKTAWSFVIACSLCIIVTSCKPNNGPDVPPPAPPRLEISGIVSDVYNNPLEGIQITITLPEMEKKWADAGLFGDNVKLIGYSDAQGTFAFAFWKYNNSDDGYDEPWSREITVIATDPKGIYETQEIVFPITAQTRYSDIPKYKNYIDGLVTANFVLRQTE